MAATLANGGICPTTGEDVLKADCVRDVLSLMYSCGMYDYSGHFAFNVSNWNSFKFEFPFQINFIGNFSLIFFFEFLVKTIAALEWCFVDRFACKICCIRFDHDRCSEFNGHLPVVSIAGQLREF